MSALPNSTGFLASLNTGVFVPAGAEGWSEALKLHQQLKLDASRASETRKRLGLVLVELRKRTPAGMWVQAVEGYGIHRNTATNALKEAGVHLGLTREQMAEVMQCPEAKLSNYPPKKQSGTGKSGVCTRDVQKSGVFVRGSGAPEQDVEEVEDESQYAGDAELAALGFSGESDGEEDQVDVTVTVDSQGLGTVAPAAALAGKPPVAREQAREQAVAGRIGPADLGRSRRPEAAGQMTLLSAWMELERDVEHFEDSDKAERARSIVTDGLAEIRRRLAELERAA